MFERAVEGADGKQHVEMYRKLLLRRRLLRWGLRLPGAAYVPFIGDADIAVELYKGKRKIYGADLDPDRVKVAGDRLPGDDVVVADCNGWPFPGVEDRFALADFDAYIDPYEPFRSFWTNAEKAERVIMFFTDGRRQGAGRTGHWTRPDGVKVYLPSLREIGPGGPRSHVYNKYLQCYVWPWFREYVDPWRVVDIFRYQRHTMIYWGAVVEDPEVT